MAVRVILFLFCAISSSLSARIRCGDPCRDRVIVGGVDGNLAISNDGGETWSSRNTTQGGTIRSIVEPDHGHIIFGSDTGLWTSRDDGLTWKGYQTSEMFTSVVASTINSILGLSNDGYLFKSTDGGDNWTQLTSSLPLSSNPALYVKGHVYYAGNDNGYGLLFLDANSKNPSWTQINLGGCSSSSNYIYSIVGNGSTIYVGLNYDGAPLVVTNDDFNTLTTILLDPRGTGSNYGIQALAIGPDSIYASLSNSGVAVIEAHSPLSKVTIKKTADGLASNQVNALAATSNGCVYAATDDNGFSISRDGGQTWITKTTQDGLTTSSFGAVYAVEIQ